MAVLGCFKVSNNDLESKGEKKTPLSCMRNISMRQYVGWVLLIISYGLLIPGLILPLYWYKSQRIVEEKTMLSTLSFVYEMGGWFPTSLVAFFALAVPAIKLIMLIVAHTFKKPWMSTLVVVISKWAILDALAASIIMAYFAFALQGAVPARVESGFTCFVLYCILSTAAALILDDQDISFCDQYASEHRLTRRCTRKRVYAGLAVLVASAFAITSLFLPTISIGIVGDATQMSVLSACQRLITMPNSDWKPMILILIFVVILPLMELMFLATMLIIPVDTFTSRCALRCLPLCGLLDVYNVGLVVMLIFLRALDNLEIYIPVTGFVILCIANVSILVARFMVNKHLAFKFGAAPATTTTTSSLPPNETKPTISHI